MRPSPVRSLFALVAATVLLTSGQASAKALCVFDLAGSNGDVYNFMKDYQIEAKGWGVDFELKPYTNEKAAADDFKAGLCDAVMVTGLRARQFNKFSSTIEASGGLPTYELLKQAIKLLGGEKAGKMMKAGDFETVAIFPIGAVYMFVRDKAVDTIEELAGKSIATLDFDEAAKVLVKEAGASISAADITTFAGLFNNGAVDACYGPASAYKPLELENGIKANGGVIRYPVAQLTMQLIVRSADYPADFGAKSRAWGADQFSRLLKLSEKAEKDIPAKYWIEIAEADRARYDAFFLNLRVRLRDKEKEFDAQMLTLMRRIRCKADETRGECAERRE